MKELKDYSAMELVALRKSNPEAYYDLISGKKSETKPVKSTWADYSPRELIAMKAEDPAKFQALYLSEGRRIRNKHGFP